MLVTGVGTLVALYALAYLPTSDTGRARRFYASLAVFMGAMVGIALADDLILLFVFWELTSLSSFLLIGHYSENAVAKTGAATALQVTALGGLVMSVGFLLIGQLADTFSLGTIITDPSRIARIVESPLGTVALLLILCGAFTKSAQVPFHFWLPRAMVAPTPVSAYLHAATMVKAGVFLIGRMGPIFDTSPLWLPMLVTVGAATMLFGAYQATLQRDLKACWPTRRDRRSDRSSCSTAWAAATSTGSRSSITRSTRARSSSASVSSSTARTRATSTGSAVLRGRCR
jgi:NADH:ubiquinone oxidoreductase subunit 5 (subunit L)/multisubunit Na+/H+ antiporter MnhA subunit